MSKVNQMFGLFGNAYYMVDEKPYIVIPENADYKTSAIQTHIHDNLDECEINIFNYHTDLISECNATRVAFMKDMLINEKVKFIDKINDAYAVSVAYELFNKDGKIIKTGESSIGARFCTALINNAIDSSNVMEYRKGFIFNGRIELEVPSVARYGIKNTYDQHPYTLRIKSVSVKSTVGDYSYLRESDTQMESNQIHNAHHIHYEFHRPSDLSYVHFGSNFVTNAQVGTTLIDQMIVPAVLEIPEEYTEIELLNIPFDDNQYTVKIDNKLKNIVVNLEVLFDNFNVVYDVDDIKAIIEMNNVDEDDIPDEEVVVPPVTDDEPTDNPDVVPPNTEEEKPSTDGTETDTPIVEDIPVTE